MKKQIMSLVMATVMASSLAACGGGASSTGATTAGTTAATTAAASGDTTAAGTEAAGSEAAGGDSASGETFKLGAYLQLSGGNAAYGIEARNAIQMAVDYVNENGGFNGAKVEFVPYDTQGSAEEAVKIVSKLVEVEKADAVIGSVNSSEVFAAAGSLNKQGIYTIGLGTSPSWMVEDWPYVFRAAMNNGFAVPITVDMLVDLDMKSVGVFYGQDDASLATGNSFMDECKARGIEVLKSESYDQGDTDFSAQVANLISTNPDCIYISVIGETGPVIVKQLRQYGYSGIIFDKESFMASQVAIAGEENSSYIAFANPYVTYATIDECDIPEVKEFLQKYIDKYGEIAKTDSSYRGWDTVMVMWEASKIAGKNDSDSLKDATNKISGLQGLGGILDYTKGNREGYNTFNSFILVDGKNILWKDWIANGGYDAYKEATGNAK